jgi:hypothetical protein
MYQCIATPEFCTHVFRGFLCRLRWRNYTWKSKVLMKGSGTLAGLDSVSECASWPSWSHNSQASRYLVGVGIGFWSKGSARILWLDVCWGITLLVLASVEQRDEGAVANLKRKWEEQTVNLFSKSFEVFLDYGCMWSIYHLYLRFASVSLWV